MVKWSNLAIGGHCKRMAERFFDKWQNPHSERSYRLFAFDAYLTVGQGLFPMPLDPMHRCARFAASLPNDTPELTAYPTPTQRVSDPCSH